MLAAKGVETERQEMGKINGRADWHHARRADTALYRRCVGYMQLEKGSVGKEASSRLFSEGDAK